MPVGYNENDLARGRLGGGEAGENPPPDYRGEFGRDRDRVLYSSAFRRLAGKTQVVAAGELGDFHNRMTHSLKVAQLGRRLAEKLRGGASEAGVSRSGDRYPPPDPDLIEAACLAHDLGHPPFGHAGEQALQRAVDGIVLENFLDRHREATEEEQQKEIAEYGGFEGNAQTLRILTRLAARHPSGSRGLILTRATLDATMKYPWLRQLSGKAAAKWSVYPTDREYAEWIREDHHLAVGAPQCFEAQLMDWCDDVTYACHDVEDFYRAGLIPMDALFLFTAPRSGTAGRLEESAGTETLMSDSRAEDDAVPQDDVPVAARDFLAWVERKWRTKPEKAFDPDRVVHAWRELAHLLLIPAPYTGSRASKALLHRATSRLMTYFVDAVSWSRDGPCRYQGTLDISPDARLGCDLLQELIWYFVIERPSLASQQHGQQQIVGDLLRIYHSDATHLLPEDRREEADSHGDGLRACVDQVASMTEPGAVAMYHRLTGIRTGHHSDPIWRT